MLSEADEPLTFFLYSDITQRKERQKRVEILNRVLRHDLRNGMNIIKGSAEMLQDAVDWMFPMGVEWFGMPDDKKRHSAQLDFKLKGMTNDQLRQTWLKAVVPLCDELGLDGSQRKILSDLLLEFHLAGVDLAHLRAEIIPGAA